MSERSEVSAASPLAWEEHGSGVPVVFLHGLTFERGYWRPIIERLGSDLRSVAIDLPGHGESPGAGRPLPELAAMVHALLESLEIDRPVVVGHSLSGALASVYGTIYPVLAVVNVDQSLNVRPFAELVQRIGPELEGSGFAAAFEPIERGFGIELVPEPIRSRILATQVIDRDLVLSYWQELLHGDPEQLQAGIEQGMRAQKGPYLAVFGHALPPEERSYMEERISNLQIEEYPGSGHFVHLVDPDRFATRLRAFIEQL